jgi:phosphohistidine phosphatase
MKTLLLMRHAKSSWKDDSLDDHERPLNKRGQKSAPKMGRLIFEQNLLPDLILCSTAARARQTCQLVTKEWNRSVPTRFLDELYLCPSERYSALLRQVPDSCQRLLLIGHNPGLVEFLETAAGAVGKFPTGALALLTIDVANWSAIQPQQPLRLQNLWRPRDLD